MRIQITTALMIAVLGMTCTADYVKAECGLCVRSEPSEDSEVLKVLSFGTEVDGGRGDWIPFEDGYIASEWLSDECPMEMLGEWRITAYAYTGSPCADGIYPEACETIACNSLPFGSKVYIDGIGVRTVHDRGPGYMGDEWLDLYLGDTQECISFGDQVRKVYLVK